MTYDDQFLIKMTGDALRVRHPLCTVPADMWALLKDIEKADLRREVREAVGK